MNVGDKVKIISYGEMVWFTQGCANCTNGEWKDMQPEIVGKEGIVDDVAMAMGLQVYSLSGIPEKARWYNSNQLFKIENE